MAGVSELDKRIFEAQNKARTNPRYFITHLKTMRDQFEGNTLMRGEGRDLETHEGVDAIDEAIEFLEN